MDTANRAMSVTEDTLGTAKRSITFHPKASQPLDLKAAFHWSCVCFAAGGDLNLIKKITSSEPEPAVILKPHSVPSYWFGSDLAD